MSYPLTRRELLQLGATLAGSAVLPASLEADEKSSQKPGLPTRALGKTGEKVTIFGLGGASAKTPLTNGPMPAALEVIQKALDSGVTYFDTAPSYGNGMSETALGQVLPAHRSRIFLATKTLERTYDGAMRELEQSLKRLRTDHIDLWQMHAIFSEERDTRPAFARNGSIKALEKAIDQKMVRFGGVTGHNNSKVLADWLRRHQFDTLLAAINAADPHYHDSLVKNLLPVAKERGVGVIAMKVPAYGRILRPGAGVTIQKAIHYSLSQSGVSTVIIACDSPEMVAENVAAARESATPMTAAQQTQLLAKTADAARRSLFFRRWS